MYLSFHVYADHRETNETNERENKWKFIIIKEKRKYNKTKQKEKRCAMWGKFSGYGLELGFSWLCVFDASVK